jgi:hypothetical protein
MSGSKGILEGLSIKPKLIDDKKHTPESTNTTPSTEDNNNPVVVIETNNSNENSNNSNLVNNPIPEPNNKTNTDNNISINNSTTLSTIKPEKRVKYTDRKVQRAYWFDNDLMKLFDKHYKSPEYDKSKIMNDLLRIFLIENGKI